MLYLADTGLAHVTPKFCPLHSWIATEWEISGLDSVRLEGYRVLLDYPDPVDSQIRYHDNDPTMHLVHDEDTLKYIAI